MNFSHQKIIIFSIIVFFIFIPFLNINAQEGLKEAREGLIDSAKEAKLTNDSTVEDATGARDEMRGMIAKVIGYILAMVGVILLVQIVFAGYSWMMSGGNEETIGKSKKKITNSIIGIAIIMGAYILVNVIFGLLVTITQSS